MPENTANNDATIPKNGSTSTIGRPKRSRRKQLSSPIQSNTSRSEVTIKARISTSPKSVQSIDFPLFKPFVLNCESDELYIKTTKHTVVSLSTGDRYSSAISGYLVIL